MAGPAPARGGKRRVRIKKDRHRKGLGEEIEDPANNGVRVYPRKGTKRKHDEEEQDEGAELLSAKLSGRILKAAREQQAEVDADEAEEAFEQLAGGAGKAALSGGVLAAALRRSKAAGTAPGKGPIDSSDEEEDGEDDEFDQELRARTLSALTATTSGRAARPAPVPSLAGKGKGKGRDEDSAAGQEYEAGDDEELSPEDEKALAAFMAPDADAYRQTSLGDLVLAKLREEQKDRGLDVLPEDGEEAVPEGLDDKVVEVYRAVGQLLSRYTVGKVPKAFKIIPNLKNWEDVLWLTNPEGWSPHAMYEATKLFVSNLNARLAQRFLALVLLPRVRHEIRTQQKLHFALFMALKKATYKPGAFYKGLLLPLCATRTCTLREAVIFSSVLKRTSIPVLHSAAALLRMAEMEYCGTTSFFMRVLLDKKYALPYRVVDALVDHFVRFADDERQMPVVWHQTLLCFVQRYKDEIRPQDKEALRKLCSIQSHYLVTPEVIRELDHSLRSRGGAGAMQGVSGPAAGAVSASGRPPAPGSFQAVSHMVVIGKTVAENVTSMPPVPMLEDD